MANFYNPSQGTWLIKGEFRDSLVLDGSGVYVNAVSGNGTIVITYDSNGSSVYSSGELQYTVNSPPNTVDGGGISLVKNGVATIANTLFIPRKFSDNEAKNSAIGNVVVGFYPTMLFANGEQGVFYEPKPEYLFQDAAGTIPVTADGDPVGRNDDLSPNGNDLTQSVSADRPTYGADVSLHWLSGNGSNWHLNAGVALDLETLTAVVAIRVGGDNQRVIDNRGTGGTGGVRGWQIKSRNGQTDLVIVDDGAGRAWRWDDPGGSVAGDIRIITLRYRANDGLLRINKSEISPVQVSGNMGSILSGVQGNLFTASNNIGTQSFSGDFFGSLVTSDFLSISDIEIVENYLAKRAGVTL